MAAAKWKTAESVFLSSAIQATDSTWTGCKAKIAAARYAPGNLQPAEEDRRQQGRQSVQEDVHQVIAERRIAPEFLFDPEDAVQQGIVLLRGPGFKPDPMQPIQASQRRGSHVALVVPDKAAVPCGLVGQENGRRQGRREDPISPPEKTAGTGVPPPVPRRRRPPAGVARARPRCCLGGRWGWSIARCLGDVA